jgi:3-oxoacyl-[acyl-carrier-protein] synthase-3
MEIRDDVFVRSLGSYLGAPVTVEWAVAQGLYPQVCADEARLTATRIAGDTPPAEMTVAAARKALERVGMDSAKLDSVIHASVFQPGPDGWSLPGYTLLQLGGGTAPVTELRTGCAAMLNAMELAVGQITGAQRYDTVLITAADNFGPWVDRWANFAFITSDAGSAMLLDSTSGFARIRSINSRTIPGLEAMYRGNEPLYPPTKTPGLINEEARFEAFTRNVMPAIEAGALMSGLHAELGRQSAADAGIDLGDVTRVIFHNMSFYATDQFVMRPLGLPMERSCFEFGKALGHMGASDQAVSLERLLLTGQLKPGDHVMLLGGSAGFAVSAIVLEITEIPLWAKRN